MLYCSKCQLLSSGDCPKCGRAARKMKAPELHDPVYLINCRMLTAGMIESLLKENGIPYSISGALGAALSTYMGSAFELYNIYVPFASYSQAFRLISEVFGADQDIMARIARYNIGSEA